MTLFFGAVEGAGLFFATGFAAAFGALLRATAFFAFIGRLGFFTDLRFAGFRAEDDFFAADFLTGFFADFADLDDLEDFFGDLLDLDFFELFFAGFFFADFFEAAIRFSCSQVSVRAPCPGSGIQAARQHIARNAI